MKYRVEIKEDGDWVEYHVTDDRAAAMGLLELSKSLNPTRSIRVTGVAEKVISEYIAEKPDKIAEIVAMLKREIADLEEERNQNWSFGRYEMATSYNVRLTGVTHVLDKVQRILGEK
jgi:hypothetical protein